MKTLTTLIVCLGLIGCTGKGNKAEIGSDCQSGLDYYKSAGIEVKPDEHGPEITFLGKINVNADGVISGKPILYLCDKSGAVTIAGMGDIKIDKNKAASAVKALAPIFLVNSQTFHPSESQKIAFQKVGSEMQPDTEWRDNIEKDYVLRVMTVQADENKNYFLIVQAGNSKSYTK